MNSLLLSTILSAVVLGQDAKPQMGDFLGKFNEATGRTGVEEPMLPGLRVFGGDDSHEANPRFKYSFMGFIRIDKHTDREYLCSGTLLDSKTLLTSAHCVTEDYVRFFKAYFHRHNKQLTTKSESGSEHRFAKVYAHEKYELKNGVPINDIALVRLKTEVPRQSKTKSASEYVRLPSAKLGNPPSDVELTIVGWGLTKVNGQQSDILQEAEKLHLTDKCYTKASGLTRAQHLCATNEEFAEPCTNDSGGPLLAPATDNGYIQIGIIPAQPKCGSTKKPGVYTRILGQTNWIMATRKSFA